MQPTGTQLGTFEARLTNAGLLGDVAVTVVGESLELSAFVVPERLRAGRLVVEWLIATLGFVGFLAGVPGAGWLIVAAVVFSLATYFAMWLIAPMRSIAIPRAAVFGADLGWVWRPQDVLFMGSAIAVAGLAGTAARTVSFRFTSAAGQDRLVILHAKTGREAARLLTALAGDAGPV